MTHPGDGLDPTRNVEQPIHDTFVIIIPFPWHSVVRFRASLTPATFGPRFDLDEI